MHEISQRCISSSCFSIVSFSVIFFLALVIHSSKFIVVYENLSKPHSLHCPSETRSSGSWACRSPAWLPVMQHRILATAYLITHAHLFFTRAPSLLPYKGAKYSFPHKVSRYGCSTGVRHRPDEQPANKMQVIPKQSSQICLWRRVSVFSLN